MPMTFRGASCVRWTSVDDNMQTAKRTLPPVDPGAKGERRPRQDQTPWEIGWQAGNAGSRSDPFKIGSADAATWYRGYITGRAKRANTARGRRPEDPPQTD